MSVKRTFSQLSAMSGGTHTKFSKASGLRVAGAGTQGVCQAYCMYDMLSAMAGNVPKKTKTQNAINWSAHYQGQISESTPNKWDVTAIKNKYLQLLQKVDLDQRLRIATVDVCPDLDQLMGFLTGKRGYFHMLSPLHVTGVYIPSGARGRYFDPNCGISSFANYDNLLAFISDYHSSQPFNDTYGMAVGDMYVVQINTF
jgi:hypothetical protein